MTKNQWIAIIVCLILTALAYIGSTGLFYADYRPIRDYDLFGFFGAWIGLIYYLITTKNDKE